MTLKIEVAKKGGVGGRRRVGNTEKRQATRIGQNSKV